MRRWISLALLAAAAASAAAAPASADDASRLALAKTVMAEMHTDDTLRSTLPLMVGQLRTSLSQQGQKDEQAEAFVKRFGARMSDEIGRYSGLMAEAYAATFTEDELNQLLAFNQTPLGRKVIDRRPQLTQASFLAMERLEQDVMREVAEEVAREGTRGDAPRKM